MSRKRTPDEPSTQREAAATTATAEPPSPENTEQTQTFVERLEQQRRRARIPDPFGIARDNEAGVRLFESRRDRVMAIEFDEKPSQPVLDALKGAGYRWNPRDKVWVHPVQLESARTTRIEASRLYEQVRGMIRQEKGIEAAPEIPF
jgi:hypothetical protein